MYYIKKIKMSGSNGKVPDAIVNLEKGVNIIYGPSNTGKSYVIECINYVMGASSIRIDENKGYDTIELTLDVDGSAIVLTRKIGSSVVRLSGKLDGFEEGNYGEGGKRQLKQLWLSLIGIKEHHMIHIGSNKKARLGNRAFDHAFIIKENHIDDEDSILHSRDHSDWLKDLSAFLFLMTGNDYDDGKEHQSQETLDNKKKAVASFANAQLKSIKKQKDDLKNSNLNLSNMNVKECQQKVSDTLSRIELAEGQMNGFANDAEELSRKLYELDKKISMNRMLAERYRALHTQYQSDLKRLSFMVEGEVNKEDIKAPVKCPFCGATLVAEKKDSCIEAATHEVEKISIKITDLQSVRKDIDNETKDFVELRTKVQEELDKRENAINNYYSPKVSELRADLQRYTMILTYSQQMETLDRIEKRIRDGMKETVSQIADEENFKPKSYYDEDFLKNFNDIIEKLLKECNYEEYVSSYFDMDAFDVVVNDSKKSSFGQGYRAYLNVIVSMAMQIYLKEYGKYHPGIFAVDSPILTLKEHVDKQATTGMRVALFEYMIKQPCADQIIIVENELPELDYDGVNKIEFTKSDDGRYGFWPDYRK